MTKTNLRMMGVSLLVLGLGGVVLGVLLHAALDEPAGARASVDPPPHHGIAWSERAFENDGVDDRDDDDGDDAWGLGDPDLGGPAWASDEDIAVIASAYEDVEGDEDDDDDNEGDEEQVDDGDDDDIEIAARTRALVDRRVAQITAEADSQAVDTDWAPAVEADIAQGVATYGPPGARLVSTRCRTTLCIAEFEIPPNAEAAMQMSWLAGAGLSRALFVHGQTGAGETGRTVAYLARDGYALP